MKSTQFPFFRLGLAMGAALVGLVMMIVVACTPAQRDALKVIAPAVQEAACVVVRAVTTDGRALEACATADELADLLPELLAARDAKPAGDVVAPSTAIVAFKLEAPHHTVARRRCAAWVPAAGAPRDGPAEASEAGP